MHDHRPGKPINRILRLKCQTCGNKYKKIVHMATGNKRIGLASICCKCGHIEQYVFTENRKETEVSDEFNILSSLKGDFTVAKVECGAVPYFYCTNKSCPYWREHDPHHKPQEHDEPKTVYTPSYQVKGDNKTQKEYL